MGTRVPAAEQRSRRTRVRRLGCPQLEPKMAEGRESEDPGARSLNQTINKAEGREP